MALGCFRAFPGDLLLGQMSCYARGGSRASFETRPASFWAGSKAIVGTRWRGVRDAISVAFLEHIEHLVWERKGREIRLGDWFDLIGGTSTGAIIAGTLALGHTTRELEQFYRQRAHLVFRSSLRIPGLQARFNAKALSAEIERVVGDKTLDDPELITGFALMAKRMDTGSPWLISK
ncbi:MAG: patatin-like phospholipase family protein [Xanthobacteraceae bacterium]